MGLIIIVEIAAAITVYIFRGKVSVVFFMIHQLHCLCRVLVIVAFLFASHQVTTVVQDSLADMISNYNNSSPEFKKSVDKLQQDVSLVSTLLLSLL